MSVASALHSLRNTTPSASRSTRPGSNRGRASCWSTTATPRPWSQPWSGPPAHHPVPERYLAWGTRSTPLRRQAPCDCSRVASSWPSSATGWHSARERTGFRAISMATGFRSTFANAPPPRACTSPFGAAVRSVAIAGGIGTSFWATMSNPAVSKPSIARELSGRPPNHHLKALRADAVPDLGGATPGGGTMMLMVRRKVARSPRLDH